MFQSRQEAGRKLADKLLEQDLVPHPDQTVILGITRGGVVLAHEIAARFRAQLDVIIVKKLAAPHDPELAIGAIGETTNSIYVDSHLVSGFRISQEYINREIAAKLVEIRQREAKYRQGKEAVPLGGKDVVITDDGTATGATMIAACREVWYSHPRRVVAALPVAPLDTMERLEKEADSVIVLENPEPFFAVGQFYRQFPQLSDQEVIQLLRCY